MEDLEVFLSLNRMHQLAKKVLREESCFAKLQARDKKTISQAKQTLKELRMSSIQPTAMTKESEPLLPTTLKSVLSF